MYTQEELQKLNYKELQEIAKNLKSQGIDIKANSKQRVIVKDILEKQSEKPIKTLNKLSSSATQKANLPKTKNLQQEQ